MDIVMAGRFSFSRTTSSLRNPRNIFLWPVFLHLVCDVSSWLRMLLTPVRVLTPLRLGGSKLLLLCPPPFVLGLCYFLLTLINARVGAEQSEHIGSLAADPWEQKAAPFTEFAAANGILLPSTFETLHSGRTSTWVHPSGRESRIDYVGLPLQWL